MSNQLMFLLTMVYGFAMHMTGRIQTFLKYTQVKKLKACILNDQPLRTRSATILRALDDCLKPKEWGRTKRYKRVPGHKIIQPKLDRRIKTDLISRQIFLTGLSVNLIYDQCTLFVFITSERIIKNRLLSKLQVTLRSKVDKKLQSVGVNITIDEFKWARKPMKHIRSTEKYYEKSCRQYTEGLK